MEEEEEERRKRKTGKTRKERIGLEGATTAITPVVLAVRRPKQKGFYECAARLGCMVRLSD